MARTSASEASSQFQRRPFFCNPYLKLTLWFPHFVFSGQGSKGLAFYSSPLGQVSHVSEQIISSSSPGEESSFRTKAASGSSSPDEATICPDNLQFVSVYPSGVALGDTCRTLLFPFQACKGTAGLRTSPSLDEAPLPYLWAGCKPSLKEAYLATQTS